MECFDWNSGGFHAPTATVSLDDIEPLRFDLPKKKLMFVRRQDAPRRALPRGWLLRACEKMLRDASPMTVVECHTRLLRKGTQCAKHAVGSTLHRMEQRGLVRSAFVPMEGRRSKKERVYELSDVPSARDPAARPRAPSRA